MVEPFFGSGAVLLARPDKHHWWEGRTETVNDADGMVSNAWRAMQAEPDAVAEWVDWPVNENDLHARHIWLVSRKDSLQSQLEGDPNYYDARVAGWWLWGMACWIGGGFCSGEGPWHSVDGQLVHVGDDGQGVNRQRVHVGNGGRGVNRQLVHLGNDGQGVMGVRREGLREYMRQLQDRLRRVRVCCGDWSRVVTPAACREDTGLVGVFLDPPYSAEAGRDTKLYRVESLTVAHDAREWALAHGDDPRYRIALCGYEGEHDMPDSWECLAWKAAGGYGNQGEGAGAENAHRERVYFSPHCLKRDRVRQANMFESVEAP